MLPELASAVQILFGDPPRQFASVTVRCYSADQEMASIVPFTPEQAVQRMRDWAGVKHYPICRYVFGQGHDPTCESPFGNLNNGHRPGCDCSGATAWATGHRRHQAFGDYNTDAIIKDMWRFIHYPGGRVLGAGPRKLYEPIPRAQAIRPGVLIVKGFVDLDADGRRDDDERPGHVGLVAEVEPDFVRGYLDSLDDLWIFHCSPSRQSKVGAIRLSTAVAFGADYYFAWPKHYVINAKVAVP